MKTAKTKKLQSAPFGALSAGQVFRWNSDLYMKTDGAAPNEANAVSLEGSVAMFDGDEPAQVVDGAFVEGYDAMFDGDEPAQVVDGAFVEGYDAT